MKKSIKFLVLSLLAFITGMFLVSCGETKDNSKYSLTQANVQNMGKTFEFKALVLNFNPSKSGNSKNWYLTDKDQQGSALVHLKKEQYPEEFKIGNYIQFKGKVTNYDAGKKQILQVAVEGDVKVLEKGVQLPKNKVVSTLAEINDPKNEHKIADMENVEISLNDKNQVSLNIENKKVFFSVVGNQLPEGIKTGDKFNFKNVVIAKNGFKYGSVTLFNFSSAEKVTEAQK